MAKFTQLQTHGTYAGAEIETDPNSNVMRREAFTGDAISSAVPPDRETIEDPSVLSDTSRFRTRGEEFLGLQQPGIWGKVARAFCEQSRSQLSRRGALPHLSGKMRGY